MPQGNEWPNKWKHHSIILFGPLIWRKQQQPQGLSWVLTYPTPTLLETRLLILEGAPYGKLLNKPIKYASQLVSVYNLIKCEKCGELIN